MNHIIYSSEKKTHNAMENPKLQSMTNKQKDQKPSPKLKIFQAIQMNFSKIGINRNFAAFQAYPFNKQILISYIILSSGAICNSIFFFCKAKSFGDYTQSIYIFTGCILLIVVYAFIILNVEKLFDLIEYCENTIHISECDSDIFIAFQTKFLFFRNQMEINEYSLVQSFIFNTQA